MQTTFSSMAMLLMLCLVSCSSVSSEESTLQKHAQPAQLYGITLLETKVQFRVRSNGCTKPEDFEIALKEADQFASLSIVRTKVDRCRRMPRIIQLTKSLDYSLIPPNLPIRVVNSFDVIPD